MTPSRPLALLDAVELSYALAATVAAEQRVRALATAGPVHAHHGLLPQCVSTDVDLWVETGSIDAYLAALRTAGWDERAASESFRERGQPSTTVIHQHWPCEVEVHRSLPGFLASEREVFDVLWERRESLVIAGVKVPIVDRVAAILIAVVRALRSSVRVGQHTEEITRLATEVLPALDGAQARELRDLATATGAIDTVRPLMEHRGRGSGTATGWPRGITDDSMLRGDDS
ncbi:hypothetical protein [Demequina activiva]|uniref:Nucleotidyltransferase n=1 Tax=Demequina activiva TaxID=1582364 RepID=A0A919UKJ6_9MICO|nr:hypothetical protein [Demequina activiva]GIG53773.1 hypothetical protein Dac01nite_05250 [Demequina activiva]